MNKFKKKLVFTFAKEKDRVGYKVERCELLDVTADGAGCRKVSSIYEGKS